MARQGGVTWIGFNPQKTRGQLRFAIAHEIGHALLHEGHLGNELPRCEGLSGRVRDRQANLFASELLAPTWALEMAFPALGEHPRPWNAITGEMVRGVALAFGISLIAARIQLISYGDLHRS